MARSREVEILFPAGGIARRAGYQSQPPYTCYDCSNVRPVDTLEGRERGGSRPGITKAYAQALATGSPIQCLQPIRVVSTAQVITDKLIAIAGGTVYQDVAGTLTAVSGSVNATAKTLQATGINQKLYIGDYRATRIYGTDGTIASTNQLSATGIADWTALGIDTATDVVVLTDVDTDDSEDNVYPISAVAAGYITITGTLTDGTCSYEIGRKIKVLDPKTGLLTSIVATYGIPPINCPLVCTYRGRLVACLENTWHMSRVGDPTDWDYAYDPADPNRPVFSGNSDAGEVPAMITALIPHSDDFLVFGAMDSLWLLRGDPAWGGQIDNLSREVGIIGPNAWAKLPDSSIVFLSRDGLYTLPPGGAGFPEPLSREAVPQELLDVDAENNTISMAYDARDRGIHLFITPHAGTAGTHWWVHWQTRGLFKVAVPATQQAVCMTSHASDAGEARYVLLGGFDGYVRRFDADTTTDDGTAITSYVKIGPLKLADAGSEGIVSQLGGLLDAGSGAVTWEIHSGSTAEAAAVSTLAKATGSFAGGRNLRTSARVRGHACVLKLTSTARWAMEALHLAVSPGGRSR